MAKGKLRIVSTQKGIQVYADNVLLTHVKRIKINSIVPGKPVTAHLEVLDVQVDINVDKHTTKKLGK